MGSLLIAAALIAVVLETMWLIDHGESSHYLGIGIIAILVFVTTIVGLVLGIIGLRQKSRKLLFAVLGTVFNSFTIAFVIFSFIITTYN
ncbi:MAG: hypothetical protein HN407_03330 [Chloroflexi bacterium]|jgi:hypothetical protein|nr:hypothetical protein [Chloroflexota bacterium]